MNRSRRSLFAAMVLAAIPFSPAVAGPPLLCFPYQIGQAKSLPWGNDAFDKSKTYDASSIAADTMELLKTERSVLVRMETLRRATVYIGRDKARASELLARLASQALTNDAIGKPSAMNLFDAGFFAATIVQNGVELGWSPGEDDHAAGYLWIKRALELDRNADPEMQFGAALVAFEHNQAEFKDYLRRAVAGAKPDSNLAASIELNWACGHKPVQELKKELGDARADAGK